MIKSRISHLAAATVALTIASVVPAAAQQAVQPGSGPASVEQLVARAAKGPVRIIVRLKEPTGVALGSSEKSRANYAVAVRRLQDAVILDTFGNSAAALDASGRGVKLFHIVSMMAMAATADEIQRLAKDPRVESVVEDRINKPTLLQSLGIIKMTGAGNAYAKGATGNGRAVAILDTGVNSAHEFITGKVVSEACYNTTSAPDGASSRCPGGAASSTAAGSGADCNPAAVDGCGHGTHVAGIAAGANTSLSVGEPKNGVAKLADVVAINVFTQFTAVACGAADPCVGAYDSDINAALQRVFDLKTTTMTNIDAVNMSLGSPPTGTGTCNGAPEKPFIDQLRTVKVATVISAGNDYVVNGVGSPGCISTAITVSASSKRKTGKPERISIYSNLGKVTDTIAPGGDFNYPFHANRDGILSSYNTSNTGYAFLYGTSMAAPHVAGVIAAIKARPACRNKSVGQIETALHNTGLKIKDWRHVMGVTPITRRRIDVMALMHYLGCV